MAGCCRRLTGLVLFNDTGATDNEALGEFLEEAMGLPSPKQAAKSQAETFAARYSA